MEVEAVIERMQERQIDQITIAGSSGAKSYGRAEQAMKSWARGVRDALHEQIRKGGTSSEKNGTDR